MTTISVEELGSRAAELVESDEPMIVTRDGKHVAVLYPLRDPKDMEARRKRFLELTEKIGQYIPPDVTDEEIERDFEAFKKHRRRQ
jgi:antitoxin (DNA-binding transcriptional repressor) of toxin-antitoxin stability system